MAYNNGGMNDGFVHKTFKAATPTGYATNVLAIADLLAGKVDAQAFDSVPAKYFVRNDPRLTVLDPEHPRDLINIAIMFHPQDQPLINFVNTWIDQIKVDGTLAGVFKKYIGT